MSKLIETHKNTLSVRSGEDKLECLKFVNIMRHVVENQENRNEFLRPGYFFRKKNASYPINCDEFRNFVNVVNNNPNNKINIEHNGNFINYIGTNIDTEKELVTYKLEYYDDVMCGNDY